MNPVEAKTQTRWLNAEEMDAWLQIVGIMIKLPAALDVQLRRDAGLTHFEYQVLAGLSEAPNRTLRMSTLAMFANASLSRLSHVVDRLENKGWVFRQPCPEDGRYTNAILTDDGYRKIVASAPGHVEAVRELVIDRLTKAQLRALSSIGHRVLEAIASDASCH
ncbi:MAG TPA: MarR family transcriptional regulator [Dermatophilaceae bacterium]|jgi:DNA-binding MarR family transcriptional regulator